MSQHTMTGIGFSWIIVGGLLAAPGYAAGDKAMILVKDGAPQCTVVLGSSASAVERHAAEELRTYFRKVSGAEVPQVETIGSGVKGFPIVVGTPESNPAARTAGWLARIRELSDEGFIIRTDANGLFIAAKKPIGVLYGVYTFLEDNLDIRWFFPGEKGEYCPRMPTIEIGPMDTARNPAFTIRSTNHVCADFNGKFTDTWDWMVRNKMQIRYAPAWTTNRKELDQRGATFTGGGHTLNKLVPPETYFSVHPEYYPLIKGKREFYDSRKGGDIRQLCTSNPEVIDICAKGVISAVRDTPPEKSGFYSPCDLFALGNNDGNGWCECDRCRALDDPEEQKQGLVTTRFYKFINAVAEKALKQCPDKRMIGWGYQQFQAPPRGIKPDPRLLIMVAMHGRCYQHSYDDPACQANADKIRLVKGWAALGNEMFVHEYFSCQPAYLPLENIAARDIKYLWSIGVKAWRAEIPPPDGTFGPRWNWEFKESWIAEFPTYYLVAKLLWDPSLDPAKLKEDMYGKYYGPAAAVMKNYRELLARTWERAPGHFIYGTTSPYVGKCLVQPGCEQELLKCLSDARRAVSTDDLRRDRIAREKRYFNAIWHQALTDWGKMTSVEAANVKKRDGPIVIDGILQEADWEAAPATTNFINPETGKPATTQTFVKLLYDSDTLYVGVVAMERSPEKMMLQSTKRDEPVWKDDDLELFIDPEGTATTYFHLAVNPKGAVYDAKCVPGSFDPGWNADCEVACKTLADRWVLEMKIKVSSLRACEKKGTGTSRRVFFPAGHLYGSEPVPISSQTLRAGILDGGIWKLNVARNRRSDGGESSSWSGDGSSHQPAGFRPIVFGSQPPLVLNGGFEKATEVKSVGKWSFGNTPARLPNGWRPHEGHVGTLTVVNQDVHSGKQACKVEKGWITSYLAASTGDTLHIDFWAKGEAIDLMLFQYGKHADGRPRFSGTARIGRTQLTSEWKRYTSDFTLQKEAVSSVGLTFAAGDVFILDDVSVTKTKGAAEK